MAWLKDGVAIVLFGAVAIASVLAEQLCGADSGKCSVDWTGLYGRDTLYKGGHCGQTDGTLGDPLLTVSSLLLCVPLVYFSPNGAVFTPVAATFIGIASFLFHAANTELSDRLDDIGMCAFGAGILADLLYYQGYRAGAALLFALFTAATILFRLQADKIGNYLYASQGTVAVLVIWLGYRWGLLRQLMAAIVVLVGGVVTLIVGNNVAAFWSCIDTQLAEPHVWGHVLVAAGAVLYCRSLGLRGEYTELYNED